LLTTTTSPSYCMVYSSEDFYFSLVEFEIIEELIIQPEQEWWTWSILSESW